MSNKKTVNPKSRLRHNIAALGSVQLVSYLLPLITLPYVTRVLGVEAWGTVALVQIIIGYFTLVTNWGFAMSGTKKIAAQRDDPARLSDIFFAAWAGQWMLCVVATLVLVLFVLFVPFFNQHAVFYLYGIGGIINSVLFPVWFLNGMERMQQVAAIQIGTRAAAVPLIFLFIQYPNDAPFMIAIGSMTGLLAGAITIAWIRCNLGLIWHRPSYTRIIEELKEGTAIFGSTVWISLYTTLTPLILGLFASHSAVGYYALADRARLSAQSVLSPISQALFPRMSYLFTTDSMQARALLKQSSKIILLISASVSMTLWVLAEYIVLLLAGEKFRPAITVLQWLAPLPIIISLSNIFGIQIMLPNQKMKAFNRILGTAGALSLIIIIPLIHWKGAEGASINTLITECFVTLAMAFYLRKTGFFINSNNWKKT